MSTGSFKKKVIQILDKYLADDYLLFVFGSYAKGASARSSDIDLAVYRDKVIPSSAIVQAKEEIEKTVTLRDIDLINLTDKNIGVKLLKSIITQGVIWKEAKNSEGLLRSLKKRLISLEK